MLWKWNRSWNAIAYPEVDKLGCRECVCDGSNAIAHAARVLAGTGASPCSRADLVGSARVGACPAPRGTSVPCAGADHCQ
jgi:hypothetical protein